MKTPDTDTRVVDYLYDDLSDAQSVAFSESLDSDEDAAAEVQSFSTLLKLYRDESEELTPTVAATERLLRESERATRPWLSRVLGDLLPRMVMRPAMGVAMASVLVIGVGVFFVLSRDGDPNITTGDQGASSTESTGKDRSIAASATSAPHGASALAEARKGPQSAWQNNDLDGRDDRGAGGVDEPSSTRSITLSANERLSVKGAKTGALAGRGARTERRLDKLRQGRKLRRARRKSGKLFSARGPKPRAAAPPRARPSPRTPSQVADTVARPQKKKPAPKGNFKVANRAPVKQKKKLTPPALHNRAKMNLAKGRVALACRLFGSLVSQHRSYSRRADALLGWARCELARGSYNRAEQLIRQLMKEYPKWRKFASRWLVEIRRQRAQARLHAQRSQQRRRSKARRRPAPRRARPPARQAPSSTSN